MPRVQRARLDSDIRFLGCYPVRAVGASPVILFPLANVFVSSVLCDGVLHRETVILQTNRGSRVLWHVGILTLSANRAA